MIRIRDERSIVQKSSPESGAPDKHLIRLRRLDTCATSDALDQLSLPPAISGLEARTTGKRIAGRVIAVKLAAEPRPDGSRAHLCTAAIESAQGGDIIAVEQASGVDAAGWGGILSTAAHGVVMGSSYEEMLARR
jgi:regulator of RNase E activity RraA